MIFAFASINTSGAKKQDPKVFLGKVEKTALKDVLLYPVKIVSKVESRIVPDDDLIVIKKLVNLGDKVQKGSPLLLLRNRDMNVHYEKRVLRAPLNGIVANINVSQGEYIKKGQDLIYLNDPEKLLGKIEISAADYKKLSIGLKGTLKVSSLKLKNIPVKVKGIGTSLDQLTGTVSSELEILNRPAELIPGILGFVELETKNTEHILVDEKSLYYVGDKTYIATLEENKNTVKKVPITLGKRFNEKIEVLKGLELGQNYIKESPQFLRDGQKVIISEKK